MTKDKNLSAIEREIKKKTQNNLLNIPNNETPQKAIEVTMTGTYKLTNVNSSLENLNLRNFLEDKLSHEDGKHIGLGFFTTERMDISYFTSTFRNE